MEKTSFLFHGSTQIVKTPEIRIPKYSKDFGFGSYCTLIEKQAKRWAVRFSERGIINKYSYKLNPELKVLSFSKMTEEWLDFIVSCRSGKNHEYDIVEGPMADDTIFNYVQNFIDGKISRKNFWGLVEFKYPTHQICFHSEKSLSCLLFEEYYEVSDEK